MALISATSSSRKLSCCTSSAIVRARPCPYASIRAAEDVSRNHPRVEGEPPVRAADVARALLVVPSVPRRPDYTQDEATESSLRGHKKATLHDRQPTLVTSTTE